MTTTDPRVGEIEARLAAVPAKGESQFVGLALPVAATTELWNLRQLARADVTYLLAELRKAHEALARVEAKCVDLESAYKRHPKQPFEFGLSEAAAEVRAAVAAAKGDEQ